MYDSRVLHIPTIRCISKQENKDLYQVSEMYILSMAISFQDSLIEAKFTFLLVLSGNAYYFHVLMLLVRDQIYTDL